MPSASPLGPLRSCESGASETVGFFHAERSSEKCIDATDCIGATVGRTGGRDCQAGATDRWTNGDAALPAAPEGWPAAPASTWFPSGRDMSADAEPSSLEEPRFAEAPRSVAALRAAGLQILMASPFLTFQC